MKKYISIILTLIVLISNIVVPAYALTDAEYSDVSSVQPRFTYISSTKTNVGISDGKVTVVGAMSCYPDITTSCNVTVFLQRRAIGTSTWYNYTFNTGSGTTYCSASVKIAATSGYEYRAKAVYSANNGAETTTAYSVIAQYNPST